MMWQTVLKLSKHADEQLTVTFTASNLEKGGSKENTGAAREDMAVEDGDAVANATAVVVEAVVKAAMVVPAAAAVVVPAAAAVVVLPGSAKVVVPAGAAVVVTEAAAVVVLAAAAVVVTAATAVVVPAAAAVVVPGALALQVILNAVVAGAGSSVTHAPDAFENIADLLPLEQTESPNSST